MQVRIGPNASARSACCSRSPTCSSCCSRRSSSRPARTRYLFFIAPHGTFMPALAAWAVDSVRRRGARRHQRGLLYVLAMTSMGVYGDHPRRLGVELEVRVPGRMRSAAQIVSYEIAMGFALVGVLICDGSSISSDIVRAPGRLEPPTGTGCRCSRCSSSTSSRRSPRPTATPFDVAEGGSRKSSPASTSNIRASPSRCSSSPNT